jgi:hypothetical protein
VYLEFQTKSEKLENIQIDFSGGSISSGDRGGPKVKPFRFITTRHLIKGDTIPTEMPCMYWAK